MGRFYEIDVFRGIAIVMMVIFHFLFDLNHFYRVGLELSRGGFKIFQISIALMFLLLVGISLSISFDKKNSGVIKYFKRGLMILGFGMIITIATRFMFPENYVNFGILHLIGVSVILGYFFRKLKIWNIIIGSFIIIGGYFMNNFVVYNDYFIVFGVKSSTYSSVDYYPLIPWFGVVLIGISVGKMLYSKNGKRKFKLKDYSKVLPVKWLEFLGQKSLIIYMLHQIVLFAGFWLFGRIM